MFAMLKFVKELLQGERVEWKRLGEISKFYGGLTGKNKHDFENGRAAYIPYKNIFDNLEINPEQIGRVNVTAEEHQKEIMRGDVLFTASSETPEEVGMSSAVTKNFLEPVYLNSFSFGMRFTSEVKLLPEFSKYLFRSSFVRSQIIKTASGVTRFNISKNLFKNILIPIPPLHVQEKIVEVLDKYTALENELEAKLKIELALRKKQYTYYRNKLLTFGEEVEWKTLGEVLVSIRTGLNPRQFFKLNTEDAVNDYITIRELYKGFIVPTERTDKINNEALRLCQQRSNLEIGDILFSATGTIGEMAVVKSPPTNWNIKEGVYALKPNSLLVLPSYIRYILSTDELKKQIRDKTEGSMVQSISMKGLRQITIPVPSLSEQARIVGILNKFDTLVNSLCEGLPREIELRHKQYEYYRDQLLSFPEPE